MDIRVINKNNEIINVSRLSIMVSGKWLIGVNESKEVMKIEEYESEEEAREMLNAFGRALEEAGKKDLSNIIIHS